MIVEKVTGKQLFINSMWKFMENVGVQMLQMVITIILARLLTPSDYGIMAIVLVVITFMGLFINSGIASFIIYVKELYKEDFFTVLVVNLSVSIILLCLLILSSPYISRFYSAPEIIPLINTMAFLLPFYAVSSVYNAYAMKMSLYKTLFYRNVIVLPISGITALSLAYLGYGVWALVMQQVVSGVLMTFVLVATIKISVDGTWKLSYRVLLPMIKYGFFTLLSTLIAFVSDNISDILIGKRINASQLGYYNRGKHIPEIISNVINGVLVGVLFPAFTTYNTDISELKIKFRKTIRLLYSLLLPLLFCLLACSSPLITFLLTSKWSEAIPISQIICLYFCAVPFLQASSQVYLALGKVKTRAVIETLKMVLILSLLFAYIDNGIVAVSVVRVMVNISLMIIMIVLNKKILSYSYKEFLMDISKPFLIAILLLVIIYPITLSSISPMYILLCQIIISIVVYFFLVKLLKIEDVELLIDSVKLKLLSHK